MTDPLARALTLLDAAPAPSDPQEVERRDALRRCIDAARAQHRYALVAAAAAEALCLAVKHLEEARKQGDAAQTGPAEDALHEAKENLRDALHTLRVDAGPR